MSVADDIDFTSMSRDLVKSNESINFVEQAATTNKSTALALNQQLSSFLRGLGLDADVARNNDEWFESLGESIRLCLGDLVKQLNNAQEHNTQHTSEPTDTDQMLNLMQNFTQSMK
ncbi:hypothetical protein JCM19233_4766 [Vibrio astriarenae]|nr:hypothetical protein JCM19233_4766 [Vibrio sp. C7]